MKKEILFSVLLCTSIFGFFFSLNLGAEVITNEKLYEMIGGKSHTAMSKQLERIQEVLEGFLRGDWQKIEGAMIQMRQDIDEIGNQYAQYSNENIPMLKSLDEIRKESTALQEELQAKNYENAYQRFQSITYQCIQCHQVKRTWGKFEEAKAAKAGEKGKEEEKTKEEGKTQEGKQEKGEKKENSPKEPASKPEVTAVSYK